MLTYEDGTPLQEWANAHEPATLFSATAVANPVKDRKDLAVVEGEVRRALGDFKFACEVARACGVTTSDLHSWSDYLRDDELISSSAKTNATNSQTRRLIQHSKMAR